MEKEKTTTWQGWLFIASWVLIVAAAILYGVSEYTVNPQKGQMQENWSIVILVTGLSTLIASRLGAK